VPGLLYADSRGLRKGEGEYIVNVPAKVVHQLRLEQGDQLFWTLTEDGLDVRAPEK
jgi:hypothetical protein